MEDYLLVILILGTFFGALFAAIYYKRGLNPVKKAKKTAEISIYENLTGYREVEKNTIADILHQKDSQIKSLNARIKLLEPELAEEPQQKGVSWEEITALVNAQYPKYSMLLPLVKKQVLETTKGMSMEEILGYVKQITGNKEPQGTTDPSSVGYRADWA